MQNLTVNQIQKKPVFSGNNNADARNLSIFTETGVKTQEEKKRNSTIKKAFGIAGGVVLLGLLLSPKFIPQSTKSKIMKKIRGLENEKLKDGITKGLSYTKNVGINFTGVKDNFCAWLGERKIIGAPYRWLSNASSKLYSTTGIKTAKRIGAKPEKHFKLLTKNISKIKESLDVSKLTKEIEINGTKKTLGAWLDEVAKLSKQNADDFAKNFNPEKVDEIAKGLNESFEGISPKYRENVLSRLKKGNWKDLFKTSIYDEMYSNSEHFKKIENLTQSSLDNNTQIKTIIDAIKDSGELSKKNIYFDLEHAFRSADKNAKKCKDFFGTDLFEKLREIKGGNAATDVIFTGGVPLVAYLYANSKAKTKEDKTSLALTTGIPLGLGIAGTIYSTCKVIAGWKALLVGGIITVVSSIAGKTADRIYRKKNNLKESTLPTFNLPNQLENSGLAKSIEAGVETVLDPK